MKSFPSSEAWSLPFVNIALTEEIKFRLGGRQLVFDGGDKAWRMADDAWRRLCVGKTWR
ncbi:hypothetical protein RchiOBHm_Chr1g0343411 [Rosa chinensis]|uniref:Uncharacterized protein n=1 Tax=Rosa chinensis TaxID=74649 RepID=A0A2P6SE98_ROSCH|nr:hypothetical protein RchiOBHm_Chr1g0343411 [Rosa chinensis]